MFFSRNAIHNPLSTETVRKFQCFLALINAIHISETHIFLYMHTIITLIITETVTDEKQKQQRVVLDQRNLLSVFTHLYNDVYSNSALIALL